MSVKFRKKVGEKGLRNRVMDDQKLSDILKWELCAAFKIGWKGGDE